MKPSFALNLSDDGVTLLHRTARGWMDVGRADFADPDFTAALDYLRSTAMGLSPKGIATKLVIPNSQILFLTLEAPGPSDEDRESQIRAALEGRTPYSVDELSFDWSSSGSQVNVAVVAKETLSEAEAFAAEHRFNPVSFVAIPEAGFDKEPFLGIAASAAANLSGSQRIEPDEEIIQVVSREPARSAEEKPEPQPELETPPQSVSVSAVEHEDTLETEKQPVETISEPVETVNFQTSIASDLTSSSLSDTGATAQFPLAEDAADHVLQDGMIDGNANEDATEAAFTVDVEPTSKVETGFSSIDLRTEPVAPPTAEKTSTVSVEPLMAADSSGRLDIEEAPMAIDVQPEDDVPPMPAHLQSRVTSVEAPSDDDLPPPLSNAARMAFASRRSPENAPASKVTAPKVQANAGGHAKTAADQALAARPATGKAPTVERPAGAKPPPKFSYDDPVPPPPRMPGDPPVAPMAAPPKPQKSLRALGNLVTAPGIPGAKAKKPAAQKQTQQAINPSESNTTAVNPDSLARGLGARRAPQRGKPKYLGLIMTGVLLLMLAIVAAWSSIYLTQNAEPTDSDQIESARASSPSPQAEAEADLQTVAAPIAVEPELPSVDDEAAADGEVVTATEPADQNAISLAAAEPANEAAETPTSEPAPETGVESDVAASSVPGSPEQDEIFLAGMDTPPSSSDPLTLPAPAAAGDILPEQPMPPPPFGTVYQFDENGRIVPTTEGIVTPEGVMLVSGKPPLVPPARPETVTAAAAAVAPSPVETVVAVESPLTPAETFAADPTLADSRPRIRPEDLTPAAPAAGEDDASLAPAEDSRFASLRPRLRPAAILAAGEESRLAAEKASLATQAALSAAANAAVAEANSDGSISPMAVAVSRVPAPRPRDLSRAVEAAVAAAVQPSNRKAAPDPTPPSASEEGDDEPETASAAPRIPTRATVAKQATYVNAINLSKINLIGVYGTQSKRYALIRQSNGRYKKVRVGDSFDGGTVKAITTNEVRYQKGGRLVSLTMPKG
ncbi:hypothetical protein ACSBLW_00910 [Thioclava sp. FR2]|uniref:hypothetical protein n=1 Tax=Thioclava sp. FR2 TaxID=3445780 RepID=UPI003EC02D24